MKNSIKLSYCIVTYNNEDKIGNLLDNLEEMTSSAYQFTIYIVDNGSSDATLNVINKKKIEFKNIILMTPDQNRGFGAGNNQVLGSLNSDYHVLVNPDIIIRDNKVISKMIDYMEKNDDVGLLSPKILNLDGTVQKLYKHNPSVLDMGLRFLSPRIMKKRQAWFVHDETKYIKIGSIEHASGAFMFFRTEIFKKIQGFDERYFMYMEDADITRKVNLISQSIFYPDVNVTHMWARKSSTNFWHTLMMLNSMRKYFSKWGWKWI